MSRFLLIGGLPTAASILAWRHRRSGDRRERSKRVIRRCRQQAEPIMDDGKSKYYAHALGWLEKVKKAYLAAGREDEWRTYCEGLIVKHGRKYSLVPGLRELLKGR